jgi:hypothetical protein
MESDLRQLRSPPRSKRPQRIITPPDVGHIKGARVRALLLWYEKRKGPGSLTKLFASLPVHARSFLAPEREALGVLPSNWLPESAYHAILDAMLWAPACERQRMVVEGAAAIMSSTLRGVHRALFEKLGSPAMYSRYAQMTWRLYHDDGEFRVQLVSDHAAFVTLRAWPGHHPLSCDLTMEAGRAIFGAMRFRNVVATRRTCVSVGGRQCASTYEWTIPNGV